MSKVNDPKLMGEHKHGKIFYPAITSFSSQWKGPVMVYFLFRILTN